MKVELLAYTITWILSYFVIELNYNGYLQKYNNSPETSINDKDLGSNTYKNKISNTSIVIVALIWVVFNIYITALHPVISGDWINYQLNFSGQRQSPSFGLDLLIKAVRGMGGNLYTLSRISTFICMTITMVAYRYSKDASPNTFFFLFLTEYAYLSISLLKQTFTNAFASLFFVIAINYKTKRSRIICIIIIALACLFHPSGLILVPMFVILQFPRTKRSISFYLLFIFIFAFFLRSIMFAVGRILIPVIPAIGLKILQYFNETSNTDINYVFLKSLPELCIVLLGLYKRKTLRDFVENYDDYLIVASTGEFLYLMSIYNVWLYRMIYLFHFAIFVFFGVLLKNLSLESNRKIIFWIIAISLGIIMYRFLYLTFA